LSNPDFTAHQRPANLGTAALIEIVGRVEIMRSAVVRGAPQEEIEAMRQQMHDLFDSYLDLSVEAAQLVRAIAHPR